MVSTVHPGYFLAHSLFASILFILLKQLQPFMCPGVTSVRDSIVFFLLSFTQQNLGSISQYFYLPHSLALALALDLALSLVLSLSLSLVLSTLLVFLC